jgi:hypothetical protein
MEEKGGRERVGNERLQVLRRQQFDWVREKVESFPDCGQHLDRR